MAKKGPGRAHREGLTVIQLFDMFPNDAGGRTVVRSPAVA